MVNPPPVLSTVPTDTWVNADWDQFLTFADDPTLAGGKFYYDQGFMRIEMAPLGSAHGQDNRTDCRVQWPPKYLRRQCLDA